MKTGVVWIDIYEVPEKFSNFSEICWLHICETPLVIQSRNLNAKNLTFNHVLRFRSSFFFSPSYIIPIKFHNFNLDLLWKRLILFWNFSEIDFFLRKILAILFVIHISSTFQEILALFLTFLGEAKITVPTYNLFMQHGKAKRSLEILS